MGEFQPLTSDNKTSYGHIGKRKRWKHWSILLMLGLLTLSLLGVVGVSAYVAWNLAHPEQKALDTELSELHVLGHDFNIPSFDGVELDGWIFEAAEPKGVIILAHGYRGNRLEGGTGLNLALELHEEGYHTVLFDFRNSGQSGKALTTVGYHEREDLKAVTHYMHTLYPELPIGVVGFSMGAATAIIAAAEEPLIQAVVADSPFANLDEYLRVNLPYWSNLPDIPFTQVIMSLLPTIAKMQLDVVSPRDAIKELGIEILLIHGDGDTAIPFTNSEEILTNANSSNAALWVPSGSGHVGGYADYQEEYLERVVGFFEEAFGK